MSGERGVLDACFGCGITYDDIQRLGLTNITWSGKTIAEDSPRSIPLCSRCMKSRKRLVAATVKALGLPPDTFVTPGFTVDLATRLLELLTDSTEIQIAQLDAKVTGHSDAIKALEMAHGPCDGDVHADDHVDDHDHDLDPDAIHPSSVFSRVFAGVVLMGSALVIATSRHPIATLRTACERTLDYLEQVAGE